MFLFAVCVTLFVLGTEGLDTAPHEIKCEGEPDGLKEIGCWGYAKCISGTPEIHACGSGTVLERATMTCIKPGEGNTDCYLPTECTGKADGSYPDYGDHCVTYYRCLNELNLGRFYCPTPTAFNEDLQICDYPRNLKPPCGTAPGAITTKSPSAATATIAVTVGKDSTTAAAASTAAPASSAASATMTRAPGTTSGPNPMSSTSHTPLAPVVG